MKRKLLNLLSFILLGGVLALPNLVGIENAIEASAVDKTGSIDLTKSQDGWTNSSSSSYCGGPYGAKSGGSVLCSSITDFSTFSDGKTYELKVFVTGFTNGGTNSYTVNLVNSSGTVVQTGTAVTSKLGSGSNVSSATKKESLGGTFQPYSSVTGLKIEYGSKCVLTAVKWEITKIGEGGEEEEEDGETYTLVKSLSSLSAGDTIVLGSLENSAVAGEFDTTYLKSVTASFNNETLTSSKANELVLGGENGAWTLISKAGQIGVIDEKKLSLNTDTKWDISISDSGVASITSEEYGSIQYNSSSPRFTNYKSEQSPIEIYKKAGETPVTKFALTYNANGGSGEMVDENEYTPSSEATIKECSFTAPEGKRFAYYALNSNGSGTKYQPNDKITLNSNVTLYAIWEDIPVIIGDQYTVVTSPSQLNNGDLVLFEGENAGLKYLSGAFNSSYLKAVAATADGDNLSSSDAVPMTLVKDGDNYGFKLGNKYLYENSIDLSLKDTKETPWTISINSNNEATIKATNKMFFNAGASRFKTYSSNTMAAVKLYKKSSTIKSITLSATSISGYVGETVSVSVTNCEGFVPSSYSWCTESENINLLGATNTNSINVKLDSQGTATIKIIANEEVEATCVITIEAISYDALEAGQYFITTTNNSYMMTSSFACTTDIDFENENNLWSFEYANKGDNTYYIKNNLGSYLSRQQSISSSGTNTQLGLSVTPYDYWTISGNKNDGFMLKNSSNSTYLAPSDNHDVFRSVTTQTKLNLTKELTFDKIIYEGTLLKTTYNVDEKFDSTGLSFYALYNDGVTKVAINSNLIVWNDFEANTNKVTGTVNYGGVTRTVEVTGLTITNFQAESLFLGGTFKTNYYVGENVDLTGATFNVHLVDGQTEKDVVLSNEDIDYFPKVISNDTTQIKVFLKGNELIFDTITITKLAPTFVVANYVKEGDQIVIGKLDYDAYGITGGEELEFVNNQPDHASFDYSPKGLEEYVVESTSYSATIGEQSYNAYALKNRESGKYLRLNGKRFGVNKDSSITCSSSDDGYDFRYYLTYNNESFYVDFDNGSYDGSEALFENGYGYNNETQSFAQGDCYLANDGTGLISLTVYTIANNYEGEVVDIDVTWLFNGTINISIPNSKTETVTEDAAWFMIFDKNYGTWSLKNYSDMDKICSYNPDGDGNFGFYETSYGDIVIYRNNTIALANQVTSISVNEEYIKTSYITGEQFAWTSLEVNVFYQGGASSVAPVGGYDITSPDMSTPGTKEVTVSYGSVGNQKTDTFEIEVKDPEPVKPKLTEIYFSKTPTSNFYAGDEFVFDGEVTAKYSDNSTRVLSEDEFSISGVSMVIGSRKITISYTEDKITKTLQYQITVAERPIVKQLVSIEASNYKTAFFEDEQFEFTGKIVATYKEGEKTITEEINAASCLFSSFEMTAGEKEITIRYTEGDITVQTTINILVKVRPYIVSINATLTKEDYVIGESFDETTISVTGTDNEGQAKTLGVNDYEVDSSSFDATREGTYKIVITLKGSDIKTEVEVNVKPKTFDTITLKYESSKSTAKVGDTEQLIFKSPSDITWNDVIVSSDDESVATVSDTGFINYLKIGTCTITVKAKNGNGIAYYYVTVHGNTTEINLDKTEITLNNGESYKLNVTLEGADILDEPVTFSSNNEEVATVDDFGNINAVSCGNATICVRSFDGTKTAYCYVNIVQPVESISLDKNEASINIGEQLTLNATINPLDATNKDVIWSTSDSSIATVKNGVVKGLKEGQVTISVTTVDGNKTASCVIDVNAIHVSSVSLNKESIELDIGDTTTLVATITPSNATNQEVIWSSSNDEVATVNSNGKVTAVSSGTAVITCTTKDGGLKVTCSITVKGNNIVKPEDENKKSGCGGALISSSIVLTISSLAGAILIKSKERKEY